MFNYHRVISQRKCLQETFKKIQGLTKSRRLAQPSEQPFRFDIGLNILPLQH